MTETLVGMDAQVPGPEPGDTELSAARDWSGRRRLLGCR
jgi:hypothetical protein